jgi:predicted signal transduction protein with EAL and GGDEF domain
MLFVVVVVIIVVTLLLEYGNFQSFPSQFVGFPQRTLSTFELSRETQMMANKKAARGGDQMINFHRWVVLFFHVLSEFWFRVP